MIEQILTDWLSGLIKDAPILALALIVAWDLRNQFLSCQARTEEMHNRLEALTNRLLERVLSEK